MPYVKVKEVHAAWDHRCDWCDGTIFKGEAVMCTESAAGNWHGRSWRHLDCHSAASRIHPDDWETCFPGSFIRGTTEPK
jgi:hypothetical protein